MKLVISLLTILLTFSNFVYAEIIQKTNTFDNTTQTKSYYKDKNIKLPQILIFKKTGNDYYLLGKNAFRTINYLTTLENAKIKINEKQFAMIFSAVSLSFFPMNIAALGAPPEPDSIANAFINIKIGANKPTPVSAAAPIPGICPI